MTTIKLYRPEKFILDGERVGQKEITILTGDKEFAVEIRIASKDFYRELIVFASRKLQEEQ